MSLGFCYSSNKSRHKTHQNSNFFSLLHLFQLLHGSETRLKMIDFRDFFANMNEFALRLNDDSYLVHSIACISQRGTGFSIVYWIYVTPRI